VIDRGAFAAARGVTLDPFQERALDALDVGHSVLVAAPTGSGKTLVAEYAIERALADGAKTFYTTPLKALSNQKFGDLVRRHGRERVGLLTGDNSVNGEAPVVVMTTEVLRNMIYAASPTLDGLRYVVLDEVHYLQDRFRGPVWEEVIVHLAPEVDLVCLSATVSNAEEVAAWIETVRGATTAVIEERRPVELRNLYLLGERATGALHLLPTFVGHGETVRPNPEIERLERPRRRTGGGSGTWGGTGGSAQRLRPKLRTPSRVEIVELLADQQMLPAIQFVFSRAGCDQAVDQCLAAGIRLSTSDERSQIRRIAQHHTRGLDAEELDVLRYREWLVGLEAGFGAHHAGLVPPMKEAVEEAFAAGLVKVVFATETLALGINMPARSVVIEKLTKFTGERHEFLTPGEYTQLTGRAGRRGIDPLGYAVVCWSPFVGFEQVAGLVARRSDALTSSFRPTYNMAVNLVRRYSAATAHHLLNLSFAQFRTDRDVVSLERELGRTQDILGRQREAAVSAYGDVEEYRRLVSELAATRRERGGGRGVARALDTLHPGDVLVVGRRGGRVVVLAQESRRNGPPRVLALNEAKTLVRLGASDFDAPPEAVGHIELPEPYAPRSPAFRRSAVESLRRVRVRGGGRRASRDEVQDAEAAVAAHPVAQDPERDARVRASVAVERLEREATRLERRVRGRSESLARQFDRVLGVLESWGYVDGWSLTDAGETLAGIYTECDLLLAESIREGHLDGLDVAELTAVASCFTYERRGPDGDAPAPPPRWPSSRVAERARAIERLWRSLSAAEEDTGLPETRPPDPGFTLYAAEWARGDDLADVLADDELTGGDFVRNVKQYVDLLRQIALVAPDPLTRKRAHEGAEASVRGVVAAASALAQ
jgi:ATP-dependent RNA helicase HelY